MIERGDNVETAEQVVRVARFQLGVKESPPGSNCVKYNTEYYGRVVSGSAYPWCMVFVWWCFKHAGASDLFFDGKKCAGCTTFMRWAKGTGRWVTGDYRPGDVILYDFDGDRSESEHTGICESATSSYVTVIEGNTGSSSDADGGQVQRRVRPASWVIGAYRPNYKDGGDIAPGRKDDCTVDLRILHRGDRGADVRALQILLVGNGYDPNGVDSICGPGCEAAVKKYQRDHKLEVDGCVGPATWGKLLGR